MPYENVREFLGKLQSDESLAQQADTAYVTGLLGVAQDAGYDISEEDLRAALDAGSGEFDEDDLDKVVGGSLGFGGVFNTAGGTFNTAGGVFNTADGGLNFNGSFSQNGFSK